MPSTTTKYALRAPLGTEAADGPTGIKNLADDVDSKMAGYAEGLKAAIPAAGKNGRIFRATDTKEWFFDNGTAWALIVGSRGFLSTPGEESRTNVAYGLLTTPDRISGVVLPTDGVIEVLFSAMWKDTANAARAAIFIGANQLKVDSGNGVAETEAACLSFASGPGPYYGLRSCPAGLISAVNGATSVATGQAVGLVTPTSTGIVPQIELGAAVRTLEEGIYGGKCEIELPAGVYDVSVQFKAASGTVSAKERKLWVKTEAYAAA